MITEAFDSRGNDGNGRYRSWKLWEAELDGTDGTSASSLNVVVFVGSAGIQMAAHPEHLEQRTRPLSMLELGNFVLQNYNLS
jgi:hypothetical protein